MDLKDIKKCKECGAKLFRIHKTVEVTHSGLANLPKNCDGEVNWVSAPDSHEYESYSMSVECLNCAYEYEQEHH